MVEDAGKGRRPHLERRIGNVAVNRIADCYSQRLGGAGFQTLGVIGFARAQLGAERPAMQDFGQSNVGSRVQPSYQRSGRKADFVARHAFGCDVVGIHKIRPAERPLHGGELDTGRVVNLDEIVGRRALIILIAGCQKAQAIPIPFLAQEPIGANFGVDSFGKSLSKRQAKQIGTEIVQRYGAVKSVGKILPGVQLDFLTALVLTAAGRTFVSMTP